MKNLFIAITIIIGIFLLLIAKISPGEQLFIASMGAASFLTGFIALLYKDKIK